jgi:hypothetical protein
VAAAMYLPETVRMQDLEVFAFIIAALILLDLLAMRYGHDSRAKFWTDRR